MLNILKYTYNPLFNNINNTNYKNTQLLNKTECMIKWCIIYT